MLLEEHIVLLNSKIDFHPPFLVLVNPENWDLVWYLHLSIGENSLCLADFEQFPMILEEYQFSWNQV